MTAQRFSLGKRFVWKHGDDGGSDSFEVVQALDGGQLRLENLLTGHICEAAIAALVTALFDGHLRFELPERLAKPRKANGELVTNLKHTDLSSIPPQLALVARHRLTILEPLLALPKAERTRRWVAEYVAGIRNAANRAALAVELQEAISVASVYRWLSEYQRADGDLRALIPETTRRGGVGKSRMSPEAETLLDAVIKDILLRRETATHTDVRDELAVRINNANAQLAPSERMRLPAMSTIQRRVAALDLQQRLTAKQGIRSARRALRQHGQTAGPNLPLERVEIDHTRLDLIVVDDTDGLPLGRPTLTYCLDYATRYPLGYYLGFEPPSWHAVMECLHQAICPKPLVRKVFDTQHEWLACGVPVAMRIDNGKEFIGNDLKDACLLLGIVLEQAPVLSPEFKPGVERMFGTLNTGLIHGLPGTTFGSPLKRGDYDTIGQACVTLAEFERMLNVFLVDVYAQRFHRGMNGIPAHRWAQACQSGFSPRLPSSREELLILLGRAQTRVIHSYGIELEGLRFNTAGLSTIRHRLNGAPVKVKYHPGNLGQIHVFDPLGKEYVAVPALDAAYASGLSLWKHRVIRAHAREELGRVDIVALGEAKRQVRDIVDIARQRKRIGTRQRVARHDAADQSSQNAPSGSLPPQPDQPVTFNSAPDEDWEIALLGSRAANSAQPTTQELAP